MDRGAWQAMVNGVTKNWTQLRTHTQVESPCRLDVGMGEPKET